MSNNKKKSKCISLFFSDLNAPYINAHKIKDNKIEVEVDVGSVLDCQRCLSRLCTDTYKKGVFKICESPWEFAGPDELIDTAVLAVCFIKDGYVHHEYMENVSPSGCVGQGNPSSPLLPTRYGTIGAFFRDDDHNVYGMTCQHVFDMGGGFRSYEVPEGSPGLAIISTRMKENRDIININLGSKRWGIYCESEEYYQSIPFESKGRVKWEKTLERLRVTESIPLTYVLRL